MTLKQEITGILTTNFALPSETIAALYKSRWQIELFLNGSSNTSESSLFCTSENAVESQIWIAVSVYVHIAIIRKRLHIEENLHTILQILSLTMFAKMPLKQLLNTSTRPVPHSTRLIAKYRLYIALRLAALDNIFARQTGLPPGHAISSS